jgi:hypothetical protein
MWWGKQQISIKNKYQVIYVTKAVLRFWPVKFRSICIFYITAKRPWLLAYPLTCKALSHIKTGCLLGGTVSGTPTSIRADRAQEAALLSAVEGRWPWPTRLFGSSVKKIFYFSYISLTSFSFVFSFTLFFNFPQSN